jgi:hypothetical protein
MRDVPFDVLVPVRQHRAEDASNGRVTVLVPRFTGRFARRWITPMLRRPEVHLHLDETGSFVWRQCDGHVTVAEIALRVRDRLALKDDEARDRVATFLRRLARTDSIQFLAPEAAARDRSS